MRSQIRAPKARKVNSYPFKVNLTDIECNNSQKDHISDFLALEKKTSANFLRGPTISDTEDDKDENKNSCSSESDFLEFNDELNKIECFNEIVGIVSNTKESIIKLTSQVDKIERCENPFLKNFSGDLSNTSIKLTIKTMKSNQSCIRSKRKTRITHKHTIKSKEKLEIKETPSNSKRTNKKNDECLDLDLSISDNNRTFTSKNYKKLNNLSDSKMSFAKKVIF